MHLPRFGGGSALADRQKESAPESSLTAFSGSRKSNKIRSVTVGLSEYPAITLAIFLGILIVLFSTLAGGFFTTPNLIAILTGASALAIISMGQTFTIIAGGFDLSVAGVAPLAAVLYAQLTNVGIPPIASIALVVLLGAIVGTINGFVISRLNINPLIATLAMLSIAGGAAFAVSGGVTVSFSGTSAAFLNGMVVGEVQLFVVVTVVLAVVSGLFLRYTVLGRNIYAVGSNLEASNLAGLRTRAILLFVYAVSAGLAALAGIVVASQLFAGSGTIGSDYALLSIAAVVLGGAALTGGEGGIGGTVLGVAIIAVIGNGLQLLQISSFYQTITTGVILLAAVASQQLRRAIARRLALKEAVAGSQGLRAKSQQDSIKN